MGRNTLYKPETLEIGEKIEITGKRKQYAKQYVQNFKIRETLKGKAFASKREGSKVFIERIA